MQTQAGSSCQWQFATPPSQGRSLTEPSANAPSGQREDFAGTDGQDSGTALSDYSDDQDALRETLSVLQLDEENWGASTNQLNHPANHGYSLLSITSGLEEEDHGPEELEDDDESESKKVVYASEVPTPDFDHQEYYEDEQQSGPFSLRAGVNEVLDLVEQNILPVEVGLPEVSLAPYQNSPAPSELSILATYEYEPAAIDLLPPLPESPASAAADQRHFQEDDASDKPVSSSCNEVELLKRTLATVIQQRDASLERIQAQNSIIRDFSLAVEFLREDKQVGKTAAKQDKQSRKSFWSTGGKREKPSSPGPRQKKAASWHAGWLVGCRNSSLRVAESMWVKNPLTGQALAQIDAFLLSLPEEQSESIEDIVEAKLLQSAILRSLGKIEALELCDFALKVCYNYDLSGLARKAQFQRGLCFLWLESKNSEASFCFSLAQGIDEDHAEQLAFYQKQLANSSGS
ncbi:hypothetical protein MMC10_008461 [Thelotrema lepadinum]|nr:hypothetical protein [Thelotrema lepadinum]